MKKFTMLFLVLVLAAAVFTGCGCRNSQPMNTTVPTTMPTTAPTTMPTTVPTTEATTVPTTMATEPSTEATIEDGNGPISTEETNADARMIPGGNGRNGGILNGAGSGNGITGSITG